MNAEIKEIETTSNPYEYSTFNAAGLYIVKGQGFFFVSKFGSVLYLCSTDEAYEILNELSTNEKAEPKEDGPQTVTETFALKLVALTMGKQGSFEKINLNE